MAISISGVTVPATPAPTGATSNTPAAPADDAFANLFRSAVATLTGEVTPARDAAIAAAAAEAGQLAADGVVDAVLLDETESDAADAALAGLFGVGVPVNFADPAAVAADPAALPAGVVPGVPRENGPASRTQELRFGFSGGPAPTRGLTVTNLPTPPAAPEPTPEVATTPAPAAPPVEAVPAAERQPVTTADAARAATFFANRLLPAQVPVEALSPPVPPGGTLLDPTTVAPVSAVAGTPPTPPVPAAASDDRPSVAGDKFAAIAEAGARLAAPPAPAAASPEAPAAFAATLAAQAPDVATPEVTAPAPRPAADVPAPIALPTEATRATATPAPVTVPGAAPVVTPQAVAAPVEVRDTPTPTARPATAPAPPAPADTEVPVEAPPQPLPARGPVIAPNRPAAVPVVATAAPAPAEPSAAALRVEAAPEPEPAPDAPTATPVPPAPPPQAATAPAPTAPVAPAPAAQIAGEITAQTRTLDRDGAVEFRMQLDPPELGRVRVNLVSSGDEVRGQIVVADDAVRRVVEGQLPELRQRLEAAGVTVQGFDVTTADPGSGGNGAAYREAALVEDVPVSRAPAARPRAARSAGGLDVLA